MIKIQEIKKNKYIKKISLIGHADYEEYSKDIVCAAISATFLTTVNGIFALNDKAIKVTSNDNLSIISVNYKDEIANTLLKNMMHCLEELEKKYPKNIKISKEEDND